MNPRYIMTPAAGAVIGYFTNWLAIKMLFRPHKPYFIGKIKVPFTPGLIPKEKERIALSLGDTVGNYILTQDVMLDYLNKPNVISSLSSSLDKGFHSLKSSDLTVDQGLSRIMGSDREMSIAAIQATVVKILESFLRNPHLNDDVTSILYNKVHQLLSTQMKDLPTEKILSVLKTAVASCAQDIAKKDALRNIIEKSMWEFLLNLKDDERKLCEIASYSSVQEIKDYLSLKTPAMVNSLISLTENPKVEKAIKAKIIGIIQSFAGPFVGMFINADDIYVRLIESLTVYINDPESMPEIESAVGLIVDKAADMTVGEVSGLITGELREVTINKVIGFILGEVTKSETIDGLIDKLASYVDQHEENSILDVFNTFDNNTEESLKTLISSMVNGLFAKASLSLAGDIIDKQTQRLLEQKISTLAHKVSPNTFENIKNGIFALYSQSLKTIAPKLITAFNVPKIVEERINSFSIQYTEELILAIVNKELQAITAVGGILGFIIGLLPVLIELL